MGLFESIRRWLTSQEPRLMVPSPVPARTAAPGPASVPTVVSNPSIGLEPPPAPAATEPPVFPYPLVTVHGRDALSTWARLRRDPDNWPVVLGDDDDLAMIREGIEEIDARSPAEILALAANLSFPASLAARRDDDERRAREWLREHGHGSEGDGTGERPEPPLGAWPANVEPIGFTVASDVVTGQFHDRIHIAILPCSTGWEAMAFLRWGNWNENPAAEYHVAALRTWNEAFGAELVGCSRDVINLHVATRPFTREAALDLARAQYLYCNDLIEQGTETFAALAAALMADDWWYFWWD